MPSNTLPCPQMDRKRSQSMNCWKHNWSSEHHSFPAKGCNIQFSPPPTPETFCEESSCTFSHSVLHHTESPVKDSWHVSIIEIKSTSVTSTKKYWTNFLFSIVDVQHVVQFLFFTKDRFSDGCVFHFSRFTNTQRVCICSTSNQGQIRKHELRWKNEQSAVQAIAVIGSYYLKFEPSEESIIIKRWTITSNLNLSDGHRMLFSGNMELFLPIYMQSNLFWMKRFLSHGLRDVVQYASHKYQSTFAHWTLSPGDALRIRCIGLLCPNDCSLNEEYWQQSEMAVRNFLAKSDRFRKPIECLYSRIRWQCKTPIASK